MRCVLAASLAACVGCGDNADACGHVELLSAYRNIWPGHVGLDDRYVYYSDYDADGFGSHRVLRQGREGDREQVIAARPPGQRFGHGMAVDAGYLYWTIESQLGGYSLFATPLAGGASLELVSISTCTARGVAVDAIHAYAGSIRCEDIPARVVAYAHDGSGVRLIWESMDADVHAIAAVNGVAILATSAGLVRVTEAATELLDGRASEHVVIAGDEIVYSTEEAIRAIPLAGGTPRQLYIFETPITQPRAFAIDGGELYVSEPPQLLFVAGVTEEPIVVARNAGDTVLQITARDQAVYWTTLALPGMPGGLGTFSGGVLRADRPCH